MYSWYALHVLTSLFVNNSSPPPAPKCLRRLTLSCPVDTLTTIGLSIIIFSVFGTNSGDEGADDDDVNKPVPPFDAVNHLLSTTAPAGGTKSNIPLLLLVGKLNAL